MDRASGEGYCTKVKHCIWWCDEDPLFEESWFGELHLVESCEDLGYDVRCVEIWVRAAGQCEGG